MTIEEMVTRTLADRARDIQAADDLASSVIRRGTRRTRWLVVTLIVLVTVALVSASIVTYGTRRYSRTGPDPRATGVPVSTATPSQASATGPSVATPTVRITSSYRQLIGPEPTVAGTGAAISVMPRLERRGQRMWFVAPGVSVMLPATVGGTRSISAAGTGWIIFTISADFTGGDTDPGAQILFVTGGGGLRTLVTGAVRSVAVSPDGTQVASVETTDQPWAVRLLVRQIANAGLVRTVVLPTLERGSWPYRSLAWNSAGIVATNQTTNLAAAGLSVLVQSQTVTDLQPVTGVFPLPGTDELYATSSQGSGRVCVGGITLPATDPPTYACGPFGIVTPLSSGRLLVTLLDGAGTEAAAISAKDRTVTLLRLPALLAQGYLMEVVPETATTVLVKATSGTWWRWDVERNTAEPAPLPAGVDSVFSW